MDIFLSWIANMPEWISAITLIITACTAVTAITPSKADDKIINTMLSVLNFAAGNFGKNKNADS